jgi:hypothetical protein
VRGEGVLFPGGGYSTLFIASAGQVLTTTWAPDPSPGAPDEFVVYFYLDGVLEYSLEQRPVNNPWIVDTGGVEGCTCSNPIDYGTQPYNSL